MDKAPELARYVVTYYSHLMTKAELLARRHLTAAMKATHGGSDKQAQADTRNHRMLSRWLSNDPEVLRLAANGYEAFAQQTATRILSEHGDRVVINRCPACGALARTPKARQCRFCGHDWHGKG